MKRSGLLAVLNRVLTALGHLAGHWPGTVLAVVLLITAFSIAPAARTLREIDYNLLDVLTRGMPCAEAYKKLDIDFGILDRHFLVIRLKDKNDLPAAKELADRLADAMRAEKELITSAHSRIDIKDFISKNACLYLDEDLTKSLAERLSDEGLERAMAKSAQRLEAGVPLKAVEADPLGLAELAPSVAERRGAGGLPISMDGYIVSRDGKMVLVAMTPTTPLGDSIFVKRLIGETDKVIERVRGEYFAGERAAVAPRVEVLIAGPYAAAEQHSRLLLNGILLSWASALLIPLLMFAIPFRRPLSFLFVGVPLVLPIFWTMALAPYVLGGQLSLVGAAFASVLLGMGIDFAVLLYNRYVAERALGRTPEEAAGICVARTGEGIFIGALTIVAAFAGMAFTRFRGFQEFGVLAALGITLTMIGLILSVPAALTLLERLRGPQHAAPPHPMSLGLPGLWRLTRGFPGTIVTVVLVGLVASVACLFTNPTGRSLRFESDFAAIGPPPEIDTTGTLNKEVSRAFEMADRTASVVIRGRTQAEVLVRTDNISRNARRLVEEKRLMRSNCILDMVPSPQSQEKSLAMAREKLLPLMDGFRARLDRAAEKAGFKPGAFAGFVGMVDGLAGRIRSGERLDPEHLADPLISELAGMCFRAPPKPGEEYQALCTLELPYGSLESDDYVRLGNDLGLAQNDAIMTNHIMVAHELRDAVAKDMTWITLVVLGVVAVMIWVSLRRPILVLLAMSPALIGGIFMLVVMQLWPKEALTFNYINVLVFPVLVGLGVDSAINLIIRVRQDGDIGTAVTDTGRALVICAGTSIWGFFSLYQPYFSPPHWGMRSLGLIVAIGLTLALIVSMTFVPAALELLVRRQKNLFPGGDPGAMPGEGEAKPPVGTSAANKS